MKKKILISSFIVVLVLLVFLFFIPFAKAFYLGSGLFVHGVGSRYERQWISDDGKVSFVVDTAEQMYVQSWRCSGEYKTDTNTYDIYVEGDGWITAYLKEKAGMGEDIFRGETFHNIYTDSMTVYIKEVSDEISDYKVGDTIVFRRADQTFLDYFKFSYEHKKD